MANTDAFAIRLDAHRRELFDRAKERTGLALSVLLVRLLEAYVAGEVNPPGLPRFTDIPARKGK